MVEENDSQVTTAPLEVPEDETPTPAGEKNKNLKPRLSELEEAVKSEKTRAEDLFKRLQYLQADFGI